MIRYILASALFFSAITSYALENLTDTDGKIFFTNEQGDLEKIDAVFSFTPGEDGEKGEISLTVGENTYKTKKYSSRKKSGRTVFYMVFSKEQEFLNQHKACVFKGTYVRANNFAVYYGDYFHSGVELDDQSIAEELNERVPFHKYKYLGGFMFKKAIEE